MDQNLRHLMLNGTGKSQKTLDKDGAITEKPRALRLGAGFSRVLIVNKLLLAYVTYHCVHIPSIAQVLSTVQHTVD